MDREPALAFERFRVGDHVVFERSFDAAEFESFSVLSGDRNPYHHDPAYAAAQGGAGREIVPLHMTLAPLSMIAGMDFPGEPSLYLGHEVRAVKPVHYGERLRYSARIAAINASHRVLTLRVLALRAAEVVLDATMRVQARSADWSFVPLHPVRSAESRTALVTGASGEIGQAIALGLARGGWRLLLQDRGASDRRARLQDALDREGAAFDFIAADLLGDEGVGRLAEAVAGVQDLALVVHAASPAVEAPVQDHVAVAYSALKAIAEAALPTMLTRQDGAFVLIGSSAVETALAGWEGYAGAKMMGTQLLRMIDRGASPYGITGHTLAPGLVASAFSAAYRKHDQPVMMPAEVAEGLAALLDDPLSPDRDMIVDRNGTRRGRFGFGSVSAMAANAPAAAVRETASGGGRRDGASAGTARLGSVVRKVLALPADATLAGAAIGVTPGWDSLRHIELLLAVEAAFGANFTATEIEATQRYEDLLRLVARTTGGSA